VSKKIVYEVRCGACQTSFAPETRYCVHCGAPLAKGRPVASASEEFDPDRPMEEGEPIAKGPKTAIWVAMALLTAVASVLRTCVE
jgi:hypothetical protein